MGEYSKYDVSELLEMTTLDDAESMHSIATGWANTGAVLGTVKEAMVERLGEIKKVWTGPSFAVFEDFMNRTIASIDVARTQADQRAEATDTVASTADWAKQRVEEQHSKYQEAKTDGASDPLGGWSPLIVGIPGILPLGKDKPTDAEIRKPFDQQARKIMSVALEEYEQQKPAIVREVVQFKPISPPEGKDPWLTPGDEGWGEDGASGSNSSDTAGLSAVSYGGNAIGAQAPSLQSAGAPAAPTGPVPSHAMPTPAAGGPAMGGVPVGPVPPGGGRVPSVPPKLPTTPGGQTAVGPRGTAPAPRTPGLPSTRTAVGRPGVGGVNARNGGVPHQAGNRWAGRGLPKSQMAPVNRVGEPRKSGEVLGRRNVSANKSGESPKPTPRRVQSAVVRGAKNTGKQYTAKTPSDNTQRGYTSRVINPRDRIAEAGKHSRTPFVGDKMKHSAKPEPFGKRPEPMTLRTRARQEIDERRRKRREQLKQPDGLSRPVVDNGLTHSSQLDNAIPTPREAVKTDDRLWQIPTGMVPGVIGKRQWDPDTVIHHPGPIANPRQTFIESLDARLHDPGPQAFASERKPDKNSWPGAE